MFKKKITVIILSLALAVGAAVGFANAEKQEDEERNSDIYSIFFTHDIHSHIDEDDKTGGLAALAFKRKEIDEKMETDDSFLVDGGDFSMGTPFQALFKSRAGELSIMNEAGFDVTTLGNHEFDYGIGGLSEMLNVAAEDIEKTREKNKKKKTQEAKDSNIQIVTSSIDWGISQAFEESRAASLKLKEALKNYGADDYTIIEKGDKKIAVFGIMGPAAIKDMPTVKLRWHDYIKRAKAITAEIRRNKEADLLVCLSHTGAEQDIELAKKVPGIDLIVSAHRHETIKKPRVVGKTYLVACGAFNENLGHIVLKKQKDKLSVLDYKLYRISPDLNKDKDVAKEIKKLRGRLNDEFFSDYGYKHDEVLTTNDIEFTASEEVGKEQKEETLANLYGDAYLAADGQANVAVIPKGTVRAGIDKGEVTASDAFAINSIGTGPDGKPGYPLVAVYLTGKELKALAEVDASISNKMHEARLYLAGMKYKINPNRLFMNRAFDFKVRSGDGKYVKINNSKLYRVVGGLYSTQMLGVVKSKSYGLLSIEPKNRKKAKVTNFNRQILRDSQGREIKEWYAIASYLEGFKGRIPARYAKTEGRKLVSDSYNVLELIKQPNHVGVMFIAAALIPVVLIAGIVIHIVQRRKKRRGYGRRMFGASLGQRNRSVGRISVPRRKSKSDRKRKRSKFSRSAGSGISRKKNFFKR